MQTSLLVEALHREIEAAVATGSSEVLAAVERAAANIEAAARLWLIDLATEAAAGVTAQLPDGRVEVRLSGRDPELVYAADPQPEPAAAPGDEAYAARITLRLPEHLKAQVDRVAATDGVSVNTWLVRTISRGIAPQLPRRSARRLTGYGTS